MRNGGPGLTADGVAHLFEPFSSDQHDDQGIGLSTVHSIVTEIGGHLLVDSRPGHGSTITIYLPRVANTQPTAAAADSADVGEDPLPEQTVLVVEDEEQVRSAVREWLQQAGYRVLEAHSSTKALELVASHEGPIHLVLTDVVMPGMSGLRLSEELAMTRGDIPIVYMSGYPTPAHPFGRADGKTLLEKPFAPRTLLRVVRAAIDSAGAEQDQPVPPSSETTDLDPPHNDE